MERAAEHPLTAQAAPRPSPSRRIGIEAPRRSGARATYPGSRSRSPRACRRPRRQRCHGRPGSPPRGRPASRRSRGTHVPAELVDAKGVRQAWPERRAEGVGEVRVLDVRPAARARSRPAAQRARRRGGRRRTPASRARRGPDGSDARTAAAGRAPRRPTREAGTGGRRGTRHRNRTRPRARQHRRYLVSACGLAESDCKRIRTTGFICSTRPLRQPSPETCEIRTRDTGRMDTLFESDAGADDPEAGRDSAEDDRPLAARMRPATLADFVGRTQLLGDDSALRTAIEQGRPHSMILYGPPGTGKTTLARMVAEHSQAVSRSWGRAGRAQRCARCSSVPPIAGPPVGPRPCSSWTRSIASTRPSRTRCCRQSRTASSL